MEAASNHIRARLTKPSLILLLLAVSLLAITWLQYSSSSSSSTAAATIAPSLPPPPADAETCTGLYSPGQPRRHACRITEFGGIGDGTTSNTAAFRRAVASLAVLAADGGAQLTIPRGRWLTGSFNLTSNFTLFLEEGAVILGSTDPKEWPVIEALPSYGRGRERPGGRHISLIHARDVTDLVITGHNGSVDGQGSMWWDMWRNRTLVHTRGHLVEIVNSHNVLISNLTFVNSPFWTIHPVYCRNVVIKDMMILAPPDAPNTDGIDPDSSSYVCIEDCYIESGDDLVAIKSGWDHYGIATARPSEHITVLRLSGTTPTCSGIGIGSEMSGGVRDVLVRGLRVRDSAAAVRIKSDRGRGGYLANITVTGVWMDRVRVPIRVSRGADDHPDGGWDPRALPRVDGICVSDVVGNRVGRAPVLEGLEGTTYVGLRMRNVSLHGMAGKGSERWKCEHVSGASRDVFPLPCPELVSEEWNSTSTC